MLPSKIEFPEVYAAALALKQAQGEDDKCAFQLGDALIKECGPPGENGVRTGSDDKLKKARAELRLLDFDYSFDHLRNLRRIAHAFPAGDRSPAVRWSIYREARTKDMFEAALAYLKENERRVTASAVKSFVRDRKKQQAAEERKRHPKLLDREQSDPARDEAQNKFVQHARLALDQINQAKKAIAPHLDRLNDRNKLIEAMINVVEAGNAVIETLKASSPAAFREAAE